MTSARFEFVGDTQEYRVQRTGDSCQRRDDDDGNAGSDKTIFNSRGTGLLLDKPYENFAQRNIPPV